MLFLQSCFRPRAGKHALKQNVLEQGASQQGAPELSSLEGEAVSPEPRPRRRLVLQPPHNISF